MDWGVDQAGAAENLAGNISTDGCCGEGKGSRVKAPNQTDKVRLSQTGLPRPEKPQYSYARHLRQPHTTTGHAMPKCLKNNAHRPKESEDGIPQDPQLSL